MKIAYNETWLHHLQLAKEVRQWQKHNLISREQYNSIVVEYPSSFFHPNFIIRVLLFIASLIALSGATGLLALFFAEVLEQIISGLCIMYGVGSFVFLEIVFIKNAKHYKSGVTEAILYHAIGFTLGGVGGLVDFNTHVMVISTLMLCSFCAFRYLDLVSTAASIGALAFLIFFELYTAGGILQQIIPIVLIIFFMPLYLLIRKQKDKSETELWQNCLILAEALTLLIVYAAGNYLVVRELSISLMNLDISEGSDIPFAFIFYFLTVVIPLTYIFFGLKNKDIVLIRVSLLVLAFSVFTFKYYYSMGHPEITLTLSGALLLVVTILLFRYLKVPKHGYTRENILSDKWGGNANLQAFMMSQTLGGNHPVDNQGPEIGSGGSSAGGGSTENF